MKKSNSKIKKPIYKRWWFWVLIIVFLLGSCGNSEEESVEETIPTSTVVIEEVAVAITTEPTLSEKENFMNYYGFTEEIVNALETLEDFTYNAKMEQSGTHSYLMTTEVGNTYWVIIAKNNEEVFKISSAEEDWDARTVYYPEYIPATEPTIVETEAPTTPIETEAEEEVIYVYVTKSGKKYHMASCSYLNDSSYAITLDNARRSYSPCSRCNPENYYD